MKNFSHDTRSYRTWLLGLLCSSLLGMFTCGLALAQISGSVVIARIDGTINPATDDYLRTSLQKAHEEKARLFVLFMNTPGGLLPSMQSMVSRLLESDIPSVVYVHPSGGGAISAGVFITLAGNISVMAPGTSIGAAHPVSGDGQEMTADVRAKLENFAATLAKSIAERRGKNVEWAEKAVRESVAITANEAQEKGVIDFIAPDLDNLLAQLESRTVSIKGNTIALTGVKDSPRREFPMSFKQIIINILADPNIAILLGLAAMLGLGLEFYHPGALFPGIIGAVCLILSLTSVQVLPINYGGIALLVLSVVFFVVEMTMPTFGIWGFAGIISLILGSIYVVDTDMVWSVEGFQVNYLLIGSIAGFVGLAILAVGMLVIKDRKRPVFTGREGMVGKVGTVRSAFVENSIGEKEGKIFVSGEIWSAVLDAKSAAIAVGDKVVVNAVDDTELKLVVGTKPVRDSSFVA